MEPQTIPKQHSPFLKKIIFGLDIGFKVALLLLGIINLFGPLGHVGDLMAVVTLFLLWIYFDPVKLMFGASRRWMSYAVVAIFYVFFIDVILQIFRALDTSSLEFKFLYRSTDTFLLNTAATLYTPVRQFIIDIITSNIDTSGISSSAGFILLLLFALYLTFFLDFEKESFTYPMIHFFKKDEKFWAELRQTKNNRYWPLKFFLAFFCLLIFSHYMFTLVTQWFIVTIGKSTFILAFLFAVKDIQNTKIKILDTMGSFDEKLIYYVRKVFYDPKYFLTGFSILLAFHYLSDINLFVLHYIFPLIPLDEYYVKFIATASRTPVVELLFAEQAGSIIDIAANTLVYIVSTAGAFFVFAIPTAFIFMTLTRKNVKDFFEKKRNWYLLYFMFISTAVFMLSPWMSIKALISQPGENLGLYGVDLVTQPISSSGIPLRYLALGIVVMGIICFYFARAHWMQEYSITITFLLSLIYLGLYIWGFYISTLFYYLHLLTYSFATANILLLILFSILLILETLFYIGGFMYTGYIISREIITQKTKYIVTNNSMIIWTLVLLGLPMALLFGQTYESLRFTSVVLGCLFVFSYALYKEFTGVEYRDDYILSIAAAILVFHLLVVVEVFGGAFFDIESVLMFNAFGLLGSALALIKFFELRLNAFDISKREVATIIILGIIFGIFFYVVPDPFIGEFKSKTDIILIYILVTSLAEEFLFRGVIMTISEKAFSYQRALFLQSLVFMLIHFISIKSMISYYSLLGFPLWLLVLYLGIYGVLLFSFGFIAGLLYSANSKNIMRPVLFHLIVNIIPFVMLRII